MKNACKINLESLEIAPEHTSAALLHSKNPTVGKNYITEMYYVIPTKQTPEKSNVVVITERGENRNVFVMDWSKIKIARVAQTSMPKHQPLGTDPEYDTPSGGKKHIKHVKTGKGSAKTPSK